MQKSHSSHIFNTAPQGLYYRLQEIQIIKSFVYNSHAGDCIPPEPTKIQGFLNLERASTPLI